MVVLDNASRDDCLAAIELGSYPKLAGQRILFVPDAVVSHVQGASSKRRPVFVLWHEHRGMCRYYRKFEASGRNNLLNIMVFAGIWLHFAAATLAALPFVIFKSWLYKDQTISAFF